MLGVWGQGLGDRGLVVRSSKEGFKGYGVMGPAVSNENTTVVWVMP